MKRCLTFEIKCVAGQPSSVRFKARRMKFIKHLGQQTGDFTIVESIEVRMAVIGREISRMRYIREHLFPRSNRQQLAAEKRERKRERWARLGL